MRRAVLLAVLLLLGATLVAPAAASPQPTPVCRFCGGLFESAAADAGVNATVTGSEVHVDVHPDGSATWTVELRLANGSAAFRAAPDRLDATARDLTAAGYGLPRDPAFQSAAIDGDRVTLRYRVADAVERHAGLLVVDTLHDRGYQPRYQVNADRFVVSGPSGTVVANDPESGQVTGDAVVWRGDGAGEWYGGTALEGSPYVVFGPDRTAPTRLRAAVAVALATLPIVVRGITRFLLLQTGLFTVLLGAVVLAFSRWTPRPSRGVLVGLLVGLGVLAAAVPAVVHGPGWVTGPALFAVGLAAMVRSPAARQRLRRPRGQALAVGGLLVGGYLVLLGLHAVIAREWVSPPAVAFRATALAFPLAAMVPLGGALALRPDRIRPWFAAAVVAFAAVPASVLNLADPPTGLGGGLYAVALLAVAVAAPLFGALGLAVGWSLASPDDPPGPAG